MVRRVGVVRGERGAEQADVAGVGERREVLHGVVGETRLDPDPHPGLRRVLRVRQAARAGSCRGTGPRSRPTPCRARPPRVAAVAHQVDEVEALVGAADLRHRVLVVVAVLDPLEVDRLVVDRPAVLARHHPAGEERAAVADPLDLVDDRHRVVARQQEVGVERVHVELRVHAPDRGHQRLRGHLAAVDARPRASPAGCRGTGRRRGPRGRAARRGRGRAGRARVAGPRLGHARVLPSGVRVVEPGQELLELTADLVAGRQRLVVGEQARPGLLGLLEGVVLPLEGLDDLAHLLVGGQVAGDLLLALLGQGAQRRRGRRSAGRPAPRARAAPRRPAGSRAGPGSAGCGRRSRACRGPTPPA